MRENSAGKFYFHQLPDHTLIMAKKKDVKELELGACIAKPNLQWEAGIYTMRKLLESFQLPRVIRCDSSHFDLPTDSKSFNMAQPMLLYRQRSVRKLVASNLNYDKSKGKYVVIGDPLLIPEDYKGWFAHFGDPNTITDDPAIPVYTTVKNTAASGATKFLIGGTEKIVGLQMPSSKTSERPDSRSVFPGDVFKVSGTYVATTKYTKKRAFKDKILSREEQFLLCIDEGDREVLLPFEAKGQFHILTSSKDNVKVPVVQLHKIKQFPCVLKLVYGRGPSTPCSFTGTLLFSATFMEESVVSSTVFNVKNILLEIPVETVLKYNVAKNNQELIQNRGYKEAMVLYKERAELYMRQIKVSIVMPDTLDDVSLYSGPEHRAPLPPTRIRKTSTPVRQSAYEQHWLPKTKSTTHLELLSQKVPIQSNSNVTLCFGNSSFKIPVDHRGTIKVQKTYRGRPNQYSVTQMFSSPQHDVPNISPSSPRSSSPGLGRTDSSSSVEVVYENVTLLRRVVKDEIPDLPPPVPSRAPMYRMSTEEFNTSAFDNLQLGATAFSTSIDTQSVADSGVGGEDFQSSELAAQSVNDVQVILRQYGIKEDTLSIMRAQKLDGKALSKMDLGSLQKAFPSVKKLEIRKIALFIESRGQML
ncbi:hypothetical protein LOTGIDRAFT_173733 [Lottia gigantea]|uniref:CABIT domain-containing protein n=1 Tax=Lottia gigantea TaxID=225164 RepID=V4CCG7_LOTGI|nr:hypothetical protein LOTGIDRAFT_173733 [Lottia gigantea]ESO99589.1 hypothetical protein LOTGIDRAFT_173733 [Lottia gigantea]